MNERDQQTKHLKCLCCESDQLRPMERYQSAYLVQCLECKFVFSEKIPTQEELEEYYHSDYDVTRYFSPITEKRYNDLLDIFESERKTNRILDIGAGYGFFLEAAKKRGWEVFGTEIADDAIAHCAQKDIDLFKGPVETIDFGDLSFDVVVSIEVLEHLNTPNSFVQSIHRLLRPQGVFYLTTPNFDSLLRFWLGEKYDVIGYPNHLCYYTPKTLQKLMKSNGFENIQTKTTGMSVTRIKTSKGKSDQDYVSETSDDEMLRYRIEKNAGLRIAKTTINGSLNLLKVGDSLKGFFRKK